MDSCPISTLAVDSKDEKSDDEGGLSIHTGDEISTVFVLHKYTSDLIKYTRPLLKN